MDLDVTARLQYGVVSRAQALEQLTKGGVRERLASGRWKRVHPGVYQVHSGDLDWNGRASAALLHAGTGAALSRLAAAYVHGFHAKPPPVIVVAVPHNRTVNRVTGTRIVRHRTLEVTTKKRLTVMVAAQTVVDLADLPGTTRAEAVAWAADAVQAKAVTVDALSASLAGVRRHLHRRALELALGVVESGAASILEVGFVDRVLDPHGLPRMTMQQPDTVDGAGIRRDFVNEEHGVIVEVDGRIGHEGANLARDRLRDRRAARDGKLTLRGGWVDVEFDPCELALDVFGALRSRGYRGQIRPCGSGCPVARAALAG